MRAMRLSAVLGLIGLACGCASTPPDENVQVFKRAEEYPVSVFEYRIDPPDQVIVRARNIPELDAQPRPVSPEGTITYNLVGTVHVARKTPDELAAELTKLLTKYYKEPDVKVEVLGNSKFYSMFGPGFSAPTKYAHTGRNTVISAIADAGINYDTAWPERVTLNRPKRNARVTIDFTKVYEKGDLWQNFLLEEGDMLYMPHDTLTKWSIGLGKVVGPLTGASTAVTAGGNVVRPAGK